MTGRVYRHVFRIGVAGYISYGMFSIFTRQTKHALNTFARQTKHALVAGCMLTVYSVCSRGRQNTLCTCAVRNNGIMAIFTRGKVWTREGDEKLMINK